MLPVTNQHDISLTLAGWLVHDEYDYISEPNYISATSLMKPIRQIVIPPRLPPESRQEDVEDYISRALGHAAHDSLEKAWTKGYERNLKKLGYPQSVIDRVLINPTDEEVEAAENPIPLYMEQRMFRELDGFIIGGKFDQIADGLLTDLKTTSAYSWVFGGRDEEHQLQGSIYRWLDAQGYLDHELTQKFKPRITEDFIRINYIFTDWQKMQANTNKGYPARRVMHKDIPLLSLDETENILRNKVQQIQKFQQAPEEKLPECTDQELWMSEPVHKYYANPAKTSGRSTRNFNDINEARKFQVEKGGKGVIISVPGQPKRCEYCPAFEGCSQKDKYQ